MFMAWWLVQEKRMPPVIVALPQEAMRHLVQPEIRLATLRRGLVARRA